MLITNLDRVQLLTVLPRGGTIAEIGVFRGLYSRSILDTVAPDALHLIDPWSKDSGSTPAEGTVMLQAYEMVLANLRDDIASGRVLLHRDYSTQAAATFADHSFDWIYVDGMHDYANVRADLLAFKDKIKPDGFILGHDFANNARARRYDYGVIPAVREFVANEGFQIVVVTNEDHPTYLLARADNDTTLPILRDALLNRRGCSLIEIDDTLLDHFEQVEVLHANGRPHQLMRFGSQLPIGREVHLSAT